MFDFIKITNEELQTIKSYICHKETLASDISLGFLSMWKDFIDAYYILYEDTIIIRITKGEGYAFSFPIGKNIDKALDKLREYTTINEIPLRFYALTEENINYLKKYKDNLVYSFDDRFSDYIYSFDDILNFAGKKYKGQRNYINKFLKLYGEPNLKPIKKEDIKDIYTMLKKYELEHNINTLMESYELKGTKMLLDSFLDLNLIGAYITINDEIVSFTIGEVINDTLIIHVEKALKKIDGIYPLTFNYFVKMINEKYTNIKYINREDDSGDLGIRYSKMQYNPIKKETKYQLNFDSLLYNFNPPILSNDNICLTPINENDKEDYYKISISETNKYYGYNYEKDLYLSNPINSDSFYNSLIFDKQIGDSISFGIRLNPNSNLIGECVLWHFTKTSIEIGIRLIKDYHNRGIGTKAFSILAKYAKEHFKTKIIAKCYKENKNSYKMIIASGFKETKYDNEYYYFEYIEK